METRLTQNMSNECLIWTSWHCPKLELSGSFVPDLEGGHTGENQYVPYNFRVCFDQSPATLPEDTRLAEKNLLVQPGEAAFSDRSGSTSRGWGKGSVQYSVEFSQIRWLKADIERGAHPVLRPNENPSKKDARSFTTKASDFQVIVLVCHLQGQRRSDSI